jgi:hypothetical protein
MGNSIDAMFDFLLSSAYLSCPVAAIYTQSLAFHSQ